MKCVRNYISRIRLDVLILSAFHRTLQHRCSSAADEPWPPLLVLLSLTRIKAPPGNPIGSVVGVCWVVVEGLSQWDGDDGPDFFHSDRFWQVVSSWLHPSLFINKMDTYPLYPPLQGSGKLRMSGAVVVSKISVVNTLPDSWPSSQYFKNITPKHHLSVLRFSP